VEDLEALGKQTGVKVSAGERLFRSHRRVARRKAAGPWLRGRRRRRQVGRARSFGDPLAQRSATSPSSAAIIRNTSRRLSRGAVTTFRWLYLGVHLSTIATWKRSRRADGTQALGFSC